MEDDTVFTKRFIECVKKPHPERSDQVSKPTLAVYIHLNLRSDPPDLKVKTLFFIDSRLCVCITGEGQ